MDTVATIERTLTRDILRGRYAPGSRLPTVRELAEHFSVNPSTIQRVVAGLEAHGLITARQGSGLRVNDPHQTGDLSLLPVWLEVSLDDPSRATSLLEELLELRRTIAVRLIVRHRVRLRGALPSLGGLAEVALGASGTSVEAMRDADLAFARALVIATGNTVALTVFNAVARVVVDLPDVLAAMYATPDANVASLMTIVQALHADTDDLAGIAERAIGAVDEATVRRFASTLHARHGAAR